MKIKASDLEKQWGEDLEQRGVFEEPPFQGMHYENGKYVFDNLPKEQPNKVIKSKAEYFYFTDFRDVDDFIKEFENFISEELEAQKDRICEKIEGNWDDRFTSQNTKNVLNQVLYIIKELVK